MFTKNLISKVFKYYYLDNKKRLILSVPIS